VSVQAGRLALRASLTRPSKVGQRIHSLHARARSWPDGKRAFAMIW